ncbi:Lrp/AsnC family transcriptional regulator [Pseudovibrio sp. Tun.PSC04-5.I4]|uniref:Lrp/AsnC family transcriptional regulator n=1 Tax=Pseudovibrio sp. Tun.PSC04-5.I4 TaxID=1798213 RepID=UPI00329A3C52
MVSSQSVGYPLTIIATVELITDGVEEIDDARRAFLEAPQVQQCYYVTGQLDFVVVMLVADMSEYEELTRRLFFKYSNLRKFNTYVCMDKVKTGMQVPI